MKKVMFAATIEGVIFIRMSLFADMCSRDRNELLFGRAHTSCAARRAVCNMYRDRIGCASKHMRKTCRHRCGIIPCHHPVMLELRMHVLSGPGRRLLPVRLRRYYVASRACMQKGWDLHLRMCPPQTGSVSVTSPHLV